MGPLDVGWWAEPVADDRDERRRARRGRGQRGSSESGLAEAAGSAERQQAGAKSRDSGEAANAETPSAKTPRAAALDAAAARAALQAASADERPAIVRRFARPIEESPPPPPSRTIGDRIRTVVRGFGQTLITLGLVVLLFVVYELWVTDLFNHRTQHRLGTTLRHDWENGDDPLVGNGNPARPQRPGEKVARIPLGRGIANIYIPAFGPDYVFTIVEGTDPAELEEGPGHYPDSQLPGKPGNFAVAGHRVGKGSPFLNLDKLRAGSAIVIETKDYWYTYRVMGDRTTGDPTQPGNGGVRGLLIVDPGDIGVIDPVPGQPGVRPRMHLLTLTTCHPKFSARQRLIIHAQQQGGPLPKSRGVLPPALRE